MGGFRLRSVRPVPPSGEKTGTSEVLRTSVRRVRPAGHGACAGPDERRQRRWNEALAALTRLATTQRVKLMASSNGTAAWETAKLAADLVRRLGLTEAVVAGRIPARRGVDLPPVAPTRSRNSSKLIRN